MNERIRELVEQAGFTVFRAQGLKESVPPDVFADRVLINTELAKFAQLIVQECIDIVDAQWEPVLVEKIKDHFGVTE